MGSHRDQAFDHAIAQTSASQPGLSIVPKCTLVVLIGVGRDGVGRDNGARRRMSHALEKVDSASFR